MLPERFNLGETAVSESAAQRGIINGRIQPQN